MIFKQYNVNPRQDQLDKLIADIAEIKQELAATRVDLVDIVGKLDALLENDLEQKHGKEFVEAMRREFVEAMRRKYAEARETILNAQSGGGDDICVS